MRTCRRLLITFLSLGGLAWSGLGHAASNLTISVVTTSADTNREAGDLASYDITVTNIGDSPAFDLVVTDTQPPEFQNCMLNGTTNGSGVGDPFVGGYTFTSFGGFTPNALDPGDNVVLDVRCNLESTILDSSTYTNQASAVWANSLGGPTLPAVMGSDTVSTRSIQLQKGFIASSEAHTNVFDNPLRLVVGEIVRYRVWVDVLQGTAQNFTLTDLLPAGLAYVPGNQTLVGLVSNSGTNLQAAGLVCGSGTPARVGDQNTDLATLGLDCVMSPSSGGVGSGSDPVFSFGNVLNTEHDGGLELIVLEFNARVVGDTTANTVLPNVASVTTTSATTSSGVANVVHHEPVLAITKDVVQPSVAAGTRVEYVVTIRHDGTSTENAYDIVLGDVLPANLTMV
jgi:large repetitive protein